jgi:dihydroorotase-like cyclic amidohydrolase
MRMHIRNAMVVSNGKVSHGGVLSENGKIAAVFKAGESPAPDLDRRRKPLA